MTGWTERWRPEAGVVVGGNLVPSQGVVGAVLWVGVGVGDRKRCRCWLLLAAVLVFSTRGEEGDFHVPSCKDPGLSGYI